MGKKQRTAPVRTPTRKQVSRWERERRLQRMVVVAGAFILALILVIPAFGYYRENIARGQEPVVQVNDKTYTANDYVRALAYSDYLLDLQQAYLQFQAQDQSSESAKAMAGLASQQLQQVNFRRASLSMQTVEEMIDDELFRQGAARLGISATADEVTVALYERLLPAPKPEEPVDEAKRQTDFAERYQRTLADSGLTDAEYRSFVEIELLRNKLDEHLQAQMLTSTEQVHLQGIVVAEEAEAKEVHDKLAAGEDLATLAKERSLDPDLKEKGGDMGWLPRGLMGEEFDQVAFALAPGDLSQPIQAGGSYYVFKLVEKGTREIEADQLEQLKRGVLTQWLETEQSTAKIDRFVNSDKQLWAANQVAKLRKKGNAATSP